MAVALPDLPAIHSPNGAALLPQRVLQVAVTVVGLAAVVVALPELDLGIAVPLLALKVAKLVILVGTVLGISSQGVRKPGTVADPAPSGSNVQLPLVGAPAIAAVPAVIVPPPPPTDPGAQP